MEIWVKITEPFWKDSKNILKRKKRWYSKLNPRNAKFFPLVTSLKNNDRKFYHLSKNFAPGSKHQKRWTYDSWSSARPKSQADLLEKEINELEKVNDEIVEKLDAHYGFSMLENCFCLPKMLYFLRTSTCFNHPVLLEKYDKTVRDGLSEVCKVSTTKSVIFWVSGGSVRWDG